MCTRKRKSDTRPLQRRSCTQNSPSSDRTEGGKEVENRIEEKVVLLALHACSLAVRPKRELKGVVCAHILFLSFALVSSSFYIERYECFLLFFFFFVFYYSLSFIYIYLSIFLSIFFSSCISSSWTRAHSRNYITYTSMFQIEKRCVNQ